MTCICKCIGLLLTLTRIFVECATRHIRVARGYRSGLLQIWPFILFTLAYRLAMVRCVGTFGGNLPEFETAPVSLAGPYRPKTGPY